MRKQRLEIAGIDLKTNKNFKQVITTSNEFVLAVKYSGLDRDLFIKDWTLFNHKGECGSSHQINAGAYLCEHMEELTGMDLA
jgi:hypothetical protein